MRYAEGRESAAQHSERFEVLDHIPPFLFGQGQAEPVIVALHDVEQGREPTVVVEAALVLGLHEEPPLANEDAGEVHGAVGVVRGAVRRRCRSSGGKYLRASSGTVERSLFSLLVTLPSP